MSPHSSSCRAVRYGTPPSALQLLTSPPDAKHRAGLGAALLCMAPGERALVRVEAAQAYGEAGSFSFPAVAPGAALVYDVELLGVETASAKHSVRVCSQARPVRQPRLTRAGQARGDMLWEERMETAERRRKAGNALFESGDAVGAASLYEQVRTPLPE